MYVIVDFERILLDITNFEIFFSVNRDIRTQWNSLIRTRQKCKVIFPENSFEQIPIYTFALYFYVESSILPPCTHRYIDTRQRILFTYNNFIHPRSSIKLPLYDISQSAVGFMYVSDHKVTLSTSYGRSRFVFDLACYKIILRRT